MNGTQGARLLAYVTGLVNQELLLQIGYLAAENRILRAHLLPRLRLSDPERYTLAEIGKGLGCKALEKAPETLNVCFVRTPDWSNDHGIPVAFAVVVAVILLFSPLLDLEREIGLQTCGFPLGTIWRIDFA